MSEVNKKQHYQVGSGGSKPCSELELKATSTIEQWPLRTGETLGVFQVIDDGACLASQLTAD